MTSRKEWIAGLVGLALASPMVQAQVPLGLPGGTGVTPPVGGPASSALAAGGGMGAVPAAAAPKSIFSFLGITQANCEACKAKLCASQFGQMLNGLATGPVAGFTGGFIPPLCPPAPSADALAALEQRGGPLGAEAVAAKIKQSEADAKARVAAVEYLGTADCARWPEAKKALISALREDPNECVRFAAARVLNSGCCCSKEMIERLEICVAGTDTDHAPAETSSRVKATAFAALQNCLSRVPVSIPAEVPPPPVPIPRERGGQPEALPVQPLQREPSTMHSQEDAHMVTAQPGAGPPALDVRGADATENVRPDRRRRAEDPVRGLEERSAAQHLATRQEVCLPHLAQDTPGSQCHDQAERDGSCQPRGSRRRAQFLHSPCAAKSGRPRVGTDSGVAPLSSAINSSHARDADHDSGAKKSLVGLLINSWNRHPSQ